MLTFIDGGQVPLPRDIAYDKGMKLYIARHGRTNYNDLGLCNGDPSVDVHITTEGTAQAEALARKLKAVPFDHIFVSELRRTQQTADIVNQFHNASVQVEPLLNDHRSGFEGKSGKLLMEALDAAENRWTVRLNDGESIEDIKTRVAEFLDSLKAKPYDTVLVVTSQWVVYAAVAIIKGISNEEAWALDVEQGGCLVLEL